MYIYFFIIALFICWLLYRKKTKLKRKLLDKESPIINKARSFYQKNFLQYTNLKLSVLVIAKGLMFTLTLVILLSAHQTNIKALTGEIFSKFEYRNDLLMQDIVIDKKKALDQEIGLMKQVFLSTPKEEFFSYAKEDMEFRIKGMAELSKIDLVEKSDVLANKVYYRISDYYRIRQTPWLNMIWWALLVSLTPEVILKARAAIVKSSIKKELLFLKRVMIVNGSIKPVDFMVVLNEMVKNAKYHKPVLENIIRANKLNTIDNKQFYRELITKETDLPTKLFYEKLDMANNYDFDQAVINIKNEFNLTKREETRRIQKQIEWIHVAGITGFMVLVGFYMLYLIIPWLTTFDMKQIL